ncbi:hypothetical protein [Cupriavidus necator]|uniref:hypothetical protein n=1 Tax=Cupriavidus necator TaxID=106590 RepID=UPI00339D443B
MRKTILLMAICAALSACGGDDDNASPPNPGNPGTPGTPGNPGPGNPGPGNPGPGNPGPGTPAGWSDPAAISEAGAGNVNVAIDAAGNAIAVWLQREPGTADDSVMASRYVPGSGWSAPVPLENDAASATDGAHIAMDRATGRAMVVWPQLTSSGAYDIWSRSFDPASGWGDLVRIESGAGMAVQPQVGMDASGNAIAVWTQRDGQFGPFKIMANRYTAGSGWGTETAFATPNDVGVQNLRPQLAVAPSGDALAVWELTDLASNSLWTSRFSASGSWDAPVELVRDAGIDQSLSYPAIAMDGSGNATLVWGQSDTANGNLQSTLYSKRYTSAWQTTVQVAAPANEAFISQPRLSVNARGDAIVAWGRNDYALLASVAPANGAWGAATVLLDASAHSPSLPTVGLDGAGNAFVAWTKSPDGTAAADLWTNRYVAGTGWGTPVIGESYSEYAAAPVLAVNEKGNAALAWTQWIGDLGTKIASRYYTPAN